MKPWYLSKTIILNLVVTILGALAVALPQAAAIKEFITAHAAEEALVWGFLSIVLRLVSHEKIVLGD